MFKSRNFDQSVMLLCIQWHLTCNLSLRNLEEMMAERDISVDHAAIRRWGVRYSLDLLKRFSTRKRVVTGRWRMDETYIKSEVSGCSFTGLSTAMLIQMNSSLTNNETSPLPSTFCARRSHGTDGPSGLSSTDSQINRETILPFDSESRLQGRSRRRLKPIAIRQSHYLNNRLEQDHRHQTPPATEARLQVR